MARKPIPGSDDGQWGDILNTYLDVAHGPDGSLKDGSVGESKLAPAVQAKINTQGGLPSDGSITTAKLSDGAVTNVKVAANAAIDQSKIAGLTTALSSKADSAHTHIIDNISNLQTALDGKADTAHAHTIANITNLQTALDGKASSTHTHTATDIASGTITAARLGSGTANDSTYLRGDGTWSTPPTGGTTNLSSSTTATTVTVVSDTGTDAALASATITDAGVMTAADKAKLDSLATVATTGAYADLTGKPTVPAITVSSTAPSSPQVGDMWVDTSA